MRKLIFILLLCSTAFGQLQQKPMLGEQINWAHPLSKGLVGCWLINEGSGNIIQDLSGNGNVGNVTGNPVWSGQGLDFDGTGDYVSIGDKDYFTIGPAGFTVIVKLRPDGLPPAEQGERMWIVSKWSNVTNREWAWTINGYGTNYGKYQFNVWAPDGATGNERGTTVDAVVGTTVHLAAVMADNSTSTDPDVYVNGVLDNGVLEATDLASIANSTTSVEFGRRASDGENEYDGLIEYVLIFNRALSASEIALDYRESFCMFAQDDIALMAKAAEAPSVSIPIFMYHYMHHGFVLLPIIPFGIYYLRRRKCAA